MEYSPDQFANHFQEWIDNYSDDIKVITEVLSLEQAPEDLKLMAIGALNYGLKQLDLIPDFYKPVGLIDDAIILHLFAYIGIDYIIELENNRIKKHLINMAEGNEIIKAFVGKDIYRSLLNYVKTLPEEKVRQRTAKMILQDEELLNELIKDIEVELRGYQGAKIEDRKTILKDLKSFLKMKLVG
ncbi:MAG: YkvA family protein [Myxococcota bacterium]